MIAEIGNYLRSQHGLYLLLLSCSITACGGMPTQVEELESTIGLHIDNVSKVYLDTRSRAAEGVFKSRVYSWVEDVYQEDGYRVFKYSNPYRNCRLYFFTDVSGVIIRATYEGNEC